MHCAKTLHERLKDVFSSLTSPTSTRDGASPKTEDMGVGGEASATMGSAAPQQQQQRDKSVQSVPILDNLNSGSSDSDFLDAVEMVEASESPGSGGSGGNGSGDVGALGGPAASVEGVPCTTETVEAALTKAFHLTDEEFGEMGGYEHLALVGTTAVVALVGSRMIYVANCGDSRAVLCRDNQAIALTDDHKAAREDETARVEAAGGQILFWNGVRVMGLLAVSRAIGDHSLRPYVIAEPEVTIVNRHTSDELLIMASDGLWDVMNNQEACNLAKKCLLRARQRGSSRQSAARVAATVLTRAAVDRGSRDNVTVVIVDLTAPRGDDGIDNISGGGSLTQSTPLASPHRSIGGRGGSGSGHDEELRQRQRHNRSRPSLYIDSSSSNADQSKRRMNGSDPNEDGATNKDQLMGVSEGRPMSHPLPPAPSPFEMPSARAEALSRSSIGLVSPFSTDD